jgi:hypothetical protein
MATDFEKFINGRKAIAPLDPVRKAEVGAAVRALPYYDFIEDKKSIEAWFDPENPGALRDFTYTVEIAKLVAQGKKVQAHYAKHVGSTYAWHECLRLLSVTARELGHKAEWPVLDFLTEWSARISHESWSLGGWKPEVDPLHAAMAAVPSPKKVLMHGINEDGTVVHAWFRDKAHLDKHAEEFPENAVRLQGAEALKLVLSFFLKEERTLAECEWLCKVATIVACASDLERGKPAEKCRGYVQSLFTEHAKVGAFAPIYLLLRRVSKGIETSVFLEGNVEAVPAHRLVEEDYIKFFLGHTLDARLLLAALNAWRAIAKLKAWREANSEGPQR